jgi:hypothetical protein
MVKLSRDLSCRRQHGDPSPISRLDVVQLRHGQPIILVAVIYVGRKENELRVVDPFCRRTWSALMPNLMY